MPNSLHTLAGQVWRKARVALRVHGKGTFPNFPIPVRLPFGAWWLAWNDVVGKAVLKGNFERAECEFLMRLLQPGMVVLDVGAHHGYYTLLASRRVSGTGRVFAFEPSPRERKKLGWHLRWNRCSNVEVVSTALGSASGHAELFLAAGRETGCNSLRPPATSVERGTVSVPVETLDSFLSSRGVTRIDFVKLDVEGAELSVIEGAENLLSRAPRPVILVEVSDLRTAAWGYPASKVLERLTGRGYQLFEPRFEPGFERNESGNEPRSEARGAAWLAPARLTAGPYDANFVALPSERLDEFRQFLRSPVSAGRDSGS